MINGCGVQRIVARHQTHQARRIHGLAGQHTHMIERPCARHHPISADPAIGGLEPQHPIGRRRHANRPARVGAQCTKHQTRAHGHTRATGRTARNVVGVKSAGAMPMVDVVPGGPAGKLGHVERAQVQGTRLVQTRQTSGRGVSAPIAPDQAAASGHLAAAVKQIFVGQGHAVQGSGLKRALGQLGIGTARCGQCGFFIDANERFARGLPLGDALQTGLGDFQGGQFSLGNGLRHFGQAHEGDVGVSHLWAPIGAKPHKHWVRHQTADAQHRPAPRR